MLLDEYKFKLIKDSEYKLIYTLDYLYSRNKITAKQVATINQILLYTNCDNYDKVVKTINMIYARHHGNIEILPKMLLARFEEYSSIIRINKVPNEFKTDINIILENEIIVSSSNNDNYIDLLTKFNEVEIKVNGDKQINFLLDGRSIWFPTKSIKFENDRYFVDSYNFYKYCN